MMHSIALQTEGRELRRLSDDEIHAVSGGKGKDPLWCGVPNPAPSSGSTAGLLLFPLIKCN